MSQEELQIECQKIKNEMNIKYDIFGEDEIFDSEKWDAAWAKKRYLENSKRPEYIEKAKRELHSMWQTLETINDTLDTEQFRDNPVSYSFFWEFVQNQKVKIRNVLYELDKDFARTQKGLLGEKYIQGILNKYCYKYQKLENVVLKVNDEVGNTVEIDAIIIGDHEVFVCEIKNYGKPGEILEINNDGMYCRRNERGHLLEIYQKSPSEQNIRQYRSIDQLLRSEFPDMNINVVPLVINANTAVRIKNYSPHKIIKPPELFYCLEKKSDIHFTVEEREKIEKCIKKYILPERKFEIIDISDLTRLCENLSHKLEPYINYNKKIYNLVKQYNEEQHAIREKQIAIREQKAAFKEFIIGCVKFIFMAVIIVFCLYLLWLLLKALLTWLWNIFIWSIIILVVIFMLAGGVGSDY